MQAIVTAACVGLVASDLSQHLTSTKPSGKLYMLLLARVHPNTFPGRWDSHEPYMAPSRAVCCRPVVLCSARGAHWAPDLFCNKMAEDPKCKFASCTTTYREMLSWVGPPRHSCITCLYESTHAIRQSTLPKSKECSMMFTISRHGVVLLPFSAFYSAAGHSIAHNT